MPWEAVDGAEGPGALSRTAGPDAETSRRAGRPALGGRAAPSHFRAMPSMDKLGRIVLVLLVVSALVQIARLALS